VPKAHRVLRHFQSPEHRHSFGAAFALNGASCRICISAGTIAERKQIMKSRDMNQYRDVLLAMRARLLRTVDNLEQSIVDDVHTQGESNVPTHLADAASEGLDGNIALVKNEEGLVEQIDEALLSLESGAYGKCASCGKAILAARLEAIPYATRCVSCEGRREGREDRLVRPVLGHETRPWEAAT
jgi:RNA polymerase-binding transcription factor DksA